jgi:hypothetical protein
VVRFLGLRPIGSLALGVVGDRIGRRALLTLSVAMMGGATLLLGPLPTYADIGVAAPVLLVALRPIQGLSGHVATIGVVAPASTSVMPYAKLIDVNARAQRKDLDEHRALQAQRHAERHREHCLELRWRAADQEGQRHEHRGHDDDGERQYRAYYLRFTFAAERRTSTGGSSAFWGANLCGLAVVLAAKPLGGWLSTCSASRPHPRTTPWRSG